MKGTMKQKLPALLMAVILCVGLTLTGCGNSNDNTDSKDNNKKSENNEPEDTKDDAGDKEDAKEDEPEKEPEKEDKSDELSFGDTFEFDNLEITFTDDPEFTKLENEFADLDGSDIVSVPIKIKNLSDDTHSLNMFYYKQYGPKGNELDDVSAYFTKEDVAWAGDMRAGAEQETRMYFVYDGDGDYFIEFSDFSDKVEVKLPIKK